LINSIRNYLIDNKIFNKNILVALSGGPDSVSLLFLLNSVKEEFSINLSAAYVNHGLRSKEENLVDYDIVKEHCSNLGVKLHVKIFKQGEILEISKERRNSIESVSRELRYNFFNQLVAKDDLIAVAHNRDDQIETQIMRFFQGSSYEGLIGIKSERGNIIRPLINIEKSYLLSYLNSERIKFALDKTNSENDYLRNKIRNILIPTIEEVFPSFRNSLSKLEGKLLDLNQFINLKSKDLEWTNISGSWVTSYNDFLNLSYLERENEIYRVFDKTFHGDIPSYRLPNRFLKPIRKLNFKNNEIILEGHGIQFYRNKEHLIWTLLNNKLLK